VDFNKDVEDFAIGTQRKKITRASEKREK